ncbi:helix-turn-helix domain-containing protein [Janibacter hoylei]|nr:helix-turn-helix domain-containing protein [Janibacter hoylei]MCT2292283.1 helix-turn-helix domain-containing protein [Janibacter hoylei]MCW4600817.1 helix-turn-helix domain-containing protein [Janibacter hoylei]
MMVLLREELGDVLRDARRSQGRTLRDISAKASVSLGYLSEIERGEKEASSELIASICTALEVPLSAVFTEIAHRADRAERASAPLTLPVATRSEDVVSAA